MKKIALILAFLIIFSSCATTQKEPSKSWTVGFASNELVTDESTEYYLAGYKNDNIATGVLDFQQVKALYMKAGYGEILIIAVDCIGLSSGQILRIKNCLPSELRPIAHVVSTHTHAGVDTLGLWGPIAIDGKNDNFMELICRVAADTASKAYEGAKEGRLFYSSTTEGIEDLLYDSRYPKIYDERLHQLRFEAYDGTGVRIFNYAAHAEALRGDNTLISADYPHYLCDAIKRETGDDAMFLPGAVGGLIMTKRLSDENGREYPVTENVKLTGELLAGAALSVKEEREISPSIEFYSTAVEIPLDNTLFVGMGGLGILDNKIIKRGEGEYGLSVRTSVSLIRMGELSFACVPGELFPELAYGNGKELGVYATLAEMLGEEILVIGLFDDEIGYIVPPSDFLVNEEAPYITTAKDAYGENHYEETNSVGPLCAERVLSAFEKINKNFQ